MSAAAQPGEEPPAEEGAMTDAGEPPQLSGWLGAMLHVADRVNVVRRARIKTLYAIEQKLPGIEEALRVEQEKFGNLELQAGSMQVMEPASMVQKHEKVREQLEDLATEIERKKWQRDVLRGIWVLWPLTLCMEGDCHGVQLQLCGLQESVQRLDRLVGRQLFMQPDAAQMGFYQDASKVLKELTELLLPGHTDSTPPRILLYGPPGMGKSCAAVRIFEMCMEDAELKERYPDGPRLVAFGNNTNSATGKRFLLSRLRKMQFALESANTALQMSEEGMATPRTGEGQNSDDTSGVLAEVVAAKQAVRRLLWGKSYLLIVDDVWPGEAEVLEHAGCFPTAFRGACIVTSRWNLVDCFPAATATVRMRNERHVCEAILAAYVYRSKQEKRLRQEHQAVGQQLLDRLGDNALALRLVGSSLAKRHNHWDNVLQRIPKLIHDSKQMHNSDMAKHTFVLSLQWVAEYGGGRAEGMRSMLATLQQLPAMTQVPVDVVRAVWRMQCDGYEDDAFEDIMLQLLEASVVDQKQDDLFPSTQTIAFHALLLESLATGVPAGMPAPQAPKPSVATMSAAEPSPYLLGLCCVRLYGSPTASAAAAASLSELPDVEGSWPCAWWQNFSGRNLWWPAALGALLHLAEEHPVLRQVLVSAAVGRLWPAKRLDTAVAVLALLVGASALADAAMVHSHALMLGYTEVVVGVLESLTPYLVENARPIASDIQKEIRQGHAQIYKYSKRSLVVAVYYKRTEDVRLNSIKSRIQQLLLLLVAVNTGGKQLQALEASLLKHANYLGMLVEEHADDTHARLKSMQGQLGYLHAVVAASMQPNSQSAANEVQRKLEELREGQPRSTPRDGAEINAERQGVTQLLAQICGDLWGAVGPCGEHMELASAVLAWRSR